MKKWYFIFVLFILIVVAGCSKGEPLTPASPEKENDTVITNPVTPPEETPAAPGDALGENEDVIVSDFSIIYQGKSLSLLDWDHEVDLVDMFGKPLQEEVRQLGPGSDTFQGTYVKELKYQGLELELFSPKDNGKSFWVKSMQISDNKFETARGIKVGDSLEKLKDIYPELESMLDGKKDPKNKGYMIQEEIYNYIIFDIKDGTINMMKIYHELA